MEPLTPHQALAQAASLELKIAELDEDEQYFTTLGYCAHHRHWLIPEGHRGEVLPAPAINAVPFAPPYCLGIANVRGAIVPIFDVAQCMGGRTKRARYILLTGPVADPLGIVLEDIPKTLQIFDRQKAEVSAELASEDWAHALSSAYTIEQQHWHCLDLASLLTDAHERGSM